VQKLTWTPRGTEWAEYYQDTNYTPVARQHKGRLVAEFLGICQPQSVWDLGGNIGDFGRLAADQGTFTVCFDSDPAAVEKNYRQCRRENRRNLLPLLCDLTNPPPGIGWRNTERASLIERGPADTILALALIHHLAITNNVPLTGIAEFLCSLGEWLIIEFIPKEDSQVQRLLATREDIFPAYTREAFEEVFGRFYTTVQQTSLNESLRTLYLLRRI
jgi:ribosomal protein L11 methylase PrmA